MSRDVRSMGLSNVSQGKAISCFLAALMAVVAPSCAKDVRVLESVVEKKAGQSPARIGSSPDGSVTTKQKNVACPTGPCDGGAWNRTMCSCDLPTNACEQGETQYETSYTGSNGVTMRLATVPQMPMVNDLQTWSMAITLPNGDPVPEGTSISVECKMIHAGFSHGCPSTIQVTRSGDVFTASPVIFSMQGDWQLIVRIGDLDTVTFGFCAQ